MYSNLLGKKCKRVNKFMEFFTTINSVYVFAGSMLLGLVGGVLGVFAVLRKQGLVGDALAHSALPGIAVAFLIMESKFLPGLLLGALVSGLIGSLCIYLLVRYTKIKMDSAMATILSVFFGVGILLLTYIQKLPLASQSGLESFLFGKASSILREDLYFIISAFSFVLVLVLLFWKELKLFTFDHEYARISGFKREWLEFLFMTVLVVSVVMSLQLVGVVLTAAVFITPAVSALLWSSKLLSVVLLSAFFGMASGMGGASVSMFSSKMPTGPVIVVILFLFFFFSFLFAPKKGLVWKSVKSYFYSRKISEENLLGTFYRWCEGGDETWTKRDLKSASIDFLFLKRLLAKGFVKKVDGIYSFTNEGFVAAASVIEKHRLWECYLVNRMKIDPSKVHKNAESIEHILTDELVSELKMILGDPVQDPHGKPIT